MVTFRPRFRALLPLALGISVALPGASTAEPLPPTFEGVHAILPGTSPTTRTGNSTIGAAGVTIDFNLYVSYLVVGGGGGGGTSTGFDTAGSGGGGGGGIMHGTLAIDAVNYPIAVGNGGNPGAAGNNSGVTGGNSQFGSFIGFGGGGGAGGNNPGLAGGSGGGGRGHPGGAATQPGAGGLGFGGGTGASNEGAGGGGGAGGPGGDANGDDGGAGGSGFSSDISGASQFYGGGGGGGGRSDGTPGTGGSGVGGDGGNNSLASTPGTANTGGGGGGGNNDTLGSAGGSGIVIVRYSGPAIDDNGGTITSDNGDTIHTFTSVGAAALDFSALDLNLIISGNLDGSGGLEFVSGGTLTLTGTNTYTGGTTITGGTLQLGNGGTTGSITGNIVNNGSLVLNRSNEGLNLTGAISGSGDLRVVGSGIVRVTGGNSHTGGTIISGGTLRILNDQSLGAVPGALDPANITISNNARLKNEGGSITLHPNRGITLGSGGGTLEVRGNTTMHVQGPITGTGPLTKIDGGVLLLSGQGSYSGATNVETGILRLGGDDRLPAGTTLNPTDSGSFDLNGHRQQVASLTGNGSVVNSGANTATLVISPASGNVEFSGSINGNVRVEVVGTKAAPSFSAPRQQLLGASSYTGGTRVSGATLMVNGDNRLGALPAAPDAANILLENNGTLFNNGALTLNANRGITLGPGGGGLSAGFNATFTIHGQISGDAGNHLTVIGNNGTLVLTGDNTYAGNTNFLGGDPARVRVGNGGTSGLLGTGNVNLLSNTELTFNRSNAYQVENNLSGAGAFVNVEGGGTMTYAGTSTHTGPTNVNNGTLNLIGSIANSPVTVAINGRLSGTGTLGSSLAITGGTLAPGDSATTGLGMLSITGDLAFASTWELNFDGTDLGQLSLAGSFDTPLSEITLATGANFNPVLNHLYWILDNVGTTTFAAGELFDGMTGPGTGPDLLGSPASGFIDLGGIIFAAYINADLQSGNLTGGNDIALLATPEPGRALLTALALFFLLARRRR